MPECDVCGDCGGGPLFFNLCECNECPSQYCDCVDSAGVAIEDDTTWADCNPKACCYDGTCNQ